MRTDTRSILTTLTVLAVALGIGRFVLTPLIPLMRDDAGLSLVTGGWLASLNNVGYLVGALGCTVLALPQRPALRYALLASALLTLGMGLTETRALWLLLRGLTGIASAVLMVHGIAFGMARLRHDSPRLLEPLIFTGPGVGIIASGLLVAALQPLGLHSATAWCGFGVLALLAVAACWRSLAAPADEGHAAHQARPASGPVWTLVAVYALLGFAYVIPATFLPVIADQQLHLPWLREWFWPLYGAASVLATLALPWLPAAWSRRDGLAVCCASMGAGIVLCLLWPTLPGLLLGTVLIGSATMPVVLLVMGEARALGVRDPTRLIAVLTAAFSVGQIAGPPLAAWLAERQHGFAAPLLLAALAAALALALTRVRGRTRHAAHALHAEC